MIYFLALFIGIVAGLRAMMAPAAVSWMAFRGDLDLAGSWLAFLGYRWMPWVFSLAALVELVTDQLPSTPSRKVPPQFGARIVFGGLSGTVVITSTGSWVAGMILGVVGAVIGTFGGAAARAKMAAAFGKDWPAALIEDAVAIVAAAVIASLLP